MQVGGCGKASPGQNMHSLPAGLPSPCYFWHFHQHVAKSHRDLGHGCQGRNLKSGRMAASNSDPQLVRQVSARTTQPEHLEPGSAKGQGRAPLGCSRYPSSYSKLIFIGLKVRDEFRPVVVDAQRSKGWMEGADLQEGAGCPRFSFPGRPLLSFKIVGKQ